MRQHNSQRKKTASPPWSPAEQFVVPVLGMHRSGTSMVTRLLNLLGMELGWPLQPPSEDNPKGFWEHRFFQGVNIELLRAVGCHSDGYGTARELAAASERAAQVLLGEENQDELATRLGQYFGNPAWGWKDPRCMLTWGFWQRFLADYGYTNICPVIVVREPTACMQSLARRGDVTPWARAAGVPLMEYLEDMWRIYYQLLLKSAVGSLSPLLVAQEDLLDPELGPIEVARLGRYLGASESACHEALKWIDPRMDHRNQGAHPVAASTTALYRGLEQMAQRQREAFLSTSPSVPVLGRSTTVVMTAAAPEETPTPFSILVVTPLGYPYSRAFNELALSLHHGFRRLGIHAPVVREFEEVQGTPIVLGAQSLVLSSHDALPAGSIIYNLEQLEDGSEWISDSYLALLGKHRVWDYSEANVVWLEARGIKVEGICPVGHTPELECIEPAAVQDIDVLFYGSLNARRVAVLDALAEQGLEVVTASNLYGKERDQLIARSKVIVNIHYYESKVFEIVRVSYLLANGCAVVSEIGPASEDQDSLGEALVFAAYDELVNACQCLVSDPAGRAALGKNAQEIFRTRSQSRSLERLIQ